MPDPAGSPRRDLTVRPGVPADAARLAELRWEFRAPRAPVADTREDFLSRCTAWMSRQLASEAWRCWVVVREHEIVGHVWLQVVEKIPNPVAEPEWHGYLTNLYVREGDRGGAGGALLDAALAWCDAREPDSLLLWPTDGSRSLYRRKGFDATAAIMARSRFRDA